MNAKTARDILMTEQLWIFPGSISARSDILLQREIVAEQKTVPQKIEVGADLGKILGLNSVILFP